MLSIHIFSTGSEITSGKSVDTNSTYLANELSGLGYTITKFVTLPDKPELIEEEILHIMNRSGKNLILMTGGLGATEDDYTLEVGCRISKKKPIVNPAAESKLKLIAEQRGKDFQDILPISKRQTTYPEGSILLRNDVGLAVGFLLDLNDKTRLAAMPGVPSEMKNMFTQYLKPILISENETEGLLSESRWIWGQSESMFQEKFIKSHAEKINDKIEWGVTAKPAHIKVTFKSSDEKALKEIIFLLESDYKNEIANDIFSDIHKILISTKKTLSTAESCTGGLCGKIITDRSGSSEYYYGSIVSYHNSIKENVLGVKKQILETVGAVSEESATEMAIGVQSLLKTDYSISITGIAGPTGATKDKKLGLLFIGIKGKEDQPNIYKYQIPFNRELFREYAANIALFHLYQKLVEDQNK
jgi:nicotinamide-nucleotide amidase